MARDYYSILGVTPTSEDVVIRAAYRALMRRYHPDADPSGEAAERAQAINAAYAVLSDPQKRARYDGSLAAQGLIKAEPSSKRRRSRSRRFVPGPAAFVGLATLATAAAVIYIAPPIGVRPPDTVDPVGTPRPHTAAVAGEQADAAPDAAALCDNAAVSSLLKTELLRRAASVAGADEEALERAGEAAVVRLNSASSREGGRVAAGCSAFVTIDLPPGTAVEGGRTNLNSELTYGVARAGKGLFGLPGFRETGASCGRSLRWRPSIPSSQRTSISSRRAMLRLRHRRGPLVHRKRFNRSRWRSRVLAPYARPPLRRPRPRPPKPFPAVASATAGLNRRSATAAI